MSGDLQLTVTLTREEAEEIDRRLPPIGTVDIHPIDHLRQGIKDKLRTALADQGGSK